MQVRHPDSFVCALSEPARGNTRNTDCSVPTPDVLHPIGGVLYKYWVRFEVVPRHSGEKAQSDKTARRTLRKSPAPA